MRRLIAGLMGAALIALGAAAPARALGLGIRPQDHCYDRNAGTHWECESWQRHQREQQERQRQDQERRRQQELDRQERQRQQQERMREQERQRQERQRQQRERWR